MLNITGCGGRLDDEFVIQELERLTPMVVTNVEIENGLEAAIKWAKGRYIPLRLGYGSRKRILKSRMWIIVIGSGGMDEWHRELIPIARAHGMRVEIVSSEARV